MQQQDNGAGRGPQPAAEDGDRESARTQEWARNNRRRIGLINRELDGGLSATEQPELRQLQAELDQYLDQRWPLPFDRLPEAREAARREGLLRDKPTQ
jgi:hypothetical protein